MIWIFPIFIGLVIIFQTRLRHVKKNDFFKDNNEEYIKQDREANYARYRPLSDDMFIKIKESELPFRSIYREDDGIGSELIRIQKKVKLNLEVPIIRTNIPTNIEIKQRFGVSNLQTVIDGEENFTKLIQHMNQWAKLLIEYGNKKDAEIILSKAVQINSDISETYILLLELYSESGRKTNAAELLRAAENLPSVAKNRVLNFAKSISLE